MIPDRFYAILNPAAGSGRAEKGWARIRESWRADGVEVEWARTTGPRHASDLAEDAVRSGWPAVVAVGGDGTVHEVANGLLRSAGDEPTVPMGIVPIGSGNDFVRALGSPAEPVEAARSLTRAEPRRIDAGRVNDRFFLNGVGAGFDARVAIRARRIPLLRGTPLYGLALLLELATHATPSVRVRLDGREIVQGRLTLITASNGPSHGGGFLLCPDARVDDGRLDVLVADALPRRHVLRFLVHSLRGAHGEDPGIHLYRGSRVEVTSDDPLPVHVDGEILEDVAGRLAIEILPERLTVLA